MTKSPPNLTKICANCGIEKPLSAFLQMGENHQFGNICASCRKTVEAKEDQEDSHDAERLTLEYKIDHTAKIQNELEKKLHTEKLEDDYRKDREKIEQTRTEANEKHHSHEHQEKKHRETYLEKASFLGTTKRTPATKASSAEHVNRNMQFIEQHTQQERATKEDSLQRNLDTTSPFLDTQVSGKEKFTRGIAIKEFAARLGKSAPIFSSLNSQNQTAKTNSATPQTPEEVVKKSWQPKTRR